MKTTIGVGVTMLVCSLGGAVSCGGSSGGATGGAGGSAGGQPGGGAGAGATAGGGGASGSAGSPGNGGSVGGGAAGSAGLAGAGGSIERDAGSTDVKADGATIPCAVAVDGGTVACTIQIVSDHDNDLYCGLKADGRINCWAAHNDAFLFQPGKSSWPPTASNAPSNLAQLAMTNELLGSDGLDLYNLCGVDESGTGTCWISNQSKNMGPGLAAIVLSDYGVCTLGTNGAVTCEAGIAPLPATVGYTKILASEDTVAALDVTGIPHYRQASFPSGVYTDIATNDNDRVGAVRSDGTAVTFVGGDNMVTKAGSFRHIALDYDGRACALDAAGEVTCWPIETTFTLPDLTPPAGPFVQIVGAESTFCALRATGTTACWGDFQIDLPDGW